LRAGGETGGGEANQGGQVIGKRKVLPGKSRNSLRLKEIGVRREKLRREVESAKANCAGQLSPTRRKKIFPPEGTKGRGKRLWNKGGSKP